MTLFADEVYADLAPIAEQDAAHGFALRALVRALGSMFAQPEEAIRALGDGLDSWERLWNPQKTPAWLLPFAGQAVGVMVDTSKTLAQQRTQVEEEGGWKRDRLSTMVAAIAGTLASPFNMVPSPSVEYSIAKWLTSGLNFCSAGATLTKVTTQAFVGSASLQVVTTAVANEGGEIALPGTFVKGTKYTASVYLKGNAGGETGSILLGNGTESASAAFTLTTSWQRFTVTFTPTADRTGVSLAIRHNAATVVTFFADAAQVEVAATASAYFDGDTPGYRWIGVPGESTSVGSGGSKRVRVVERNSTAWTMLIITSPSETPNPAYTQIVANLVKPGGIVLSFQLSDLPAIDEGTRTIDASTGIIDTAVLSDVT
jgi:hypothetical protein